MPKKHHKSIPVKPRSIPHSSLQSSGPSASQHGHPTATRPATTPGPSSVNDLISHLRQTQFGHEADPASSSVKGSAQPQRSVHPSLRNLLNVPDTVPPRPRVGSRSVLGPRSRRTPGPPPPQSWLTGSIHAPESVRKKDQDAATATITRRWKYGSHMLPGSNLPPGGYLVDVVSRKMAKNWSFHLQYDALWLASLPTMLKQNLLSYIAGNVMELGSTYGLSRTMMTLFPPPEEVQKMMENMDIEIQDDADDVIRLDLSGAIGTWLTMRSLSRQLQATPANQTAREFSFASDNTHDVPDSWDSANQDPETTNSLPESLRAPAALRFSHLTYLSLALSPTAASGQFHPPSWISLLSLSANLSTLTSLSLAYWPMPTITPHATATNAQIENPISRSLPRIQYSSTDYYAEFENEWAEAASILRKLSRNLYCLRWLDLSGCGTWWGALCWKGGTRSEVYEVDDVNVEKVRVKDGPEWNEGWRGIEFVGLEVGWEPHIWTAVDSGEIETGAGEAQRGATAVTDRYVPPSLRPTSLRVGVARSSTVDGEDEVMRPHSAANSDRSRHDWDMGVEREKHYQRKELKRYLELIDRAENVARGIKALRREKNGKWIDFGMSSRDEAH